MLFRSHDRQPAQTKRQQPLGTDTTIEIEKITGVIPPALSSVGLLQIPGREVLQPATQDHGGQELEQGLLPQLLQQNKDNHSAGAIDRQPWPMQRATIHEVLLPAFTGMVATMVFDKERLEAEAPTGFALATDIAEWLVKNGVPFRHAHELSGACVKIAEDRGQELWDLTDEDFINVFKDFLPADKAPQVREVLSTEGSVSARNGKGGTSPLRVREQIVSAKTTIEQLRAFANSVSDGSAYKSPESLLK